MAFFTAFVISDLYATFRTVLIVMRLVHKKAVNAKLLECNHIVLSALVV